MTPPIEADQTVQEYTRQIENDIKPAFKNLAAVEVTPQMIVQLIDTKAQQAPIAANRILATVSKLFKWAKGRQSIEINPALGIEKPGKEKQRDRVLSEHEIKAFWEWTESVAFAVASNKLGDTTKYIFQLVLLTGQRPGEVCQISEHQNDRDARVWMIPKSVHKSGRVHLVPLSDAVMAILDRVDEINSRFVRRSERLLAALTSILLKRLTATGRVVAVSRREEFISSVREPLHTFDIHRPRPTE